MSKQSILTGPGEIRIFGMIVPDAWIYPEDTGFVSSEMVIDALAQCPGEVILRINSDGGDPVEGEAMRAAIEAHPHKVTAKIQGAAHSAASLMVMGADWIEMSAGSLMLIHDPSTFIGGNPAELSAVVDDLNAMADIYAGVYAARAGITADEARAIMRAGITYSAEAAVEAGFADAVTQAVKGSVMARKPPEMALAAARFAMSAARDAETKFKAGASLETGPQAPETGEDTTMTNTAPKTVAPAAPVVATPVVAAAPVTMAAPDAMAAAIAAERTRARQIREMAAPFAAHMSQADVDAMVDGETTVDQARITIMAAAAAGQIRTAPAAQITRDETETQIEGMIGALMHRSNPGRHALEGPALQYRGMRLKGLAMSLAPGARGFNDIETVKAGMRSTTLMSGALGVSDFSYITTEVMGRVLRAAYERRASAWRMISRQRSAADFREMHSIRAGGDFQLKAVGENGEFLQSKISDEAEGLKLASFGRQIDLTFEAIVNDDMGVFERIPTEFARAAGVLEASIAWGAIRANKALKSDAKALFHADHKNLGAAAAISVATVGDGRKAMFEQRPFGSVDKDDFIQVTPDLLFVPPALETVAKQFTTSTTPAQASEVNPFSSLTPVVEASLSAAAGGSDAQWYLFASDMPVLEHAYLDGYEAPTVTSKEGFGTGGVSMAARHIFAATAVEYRGAYRRG